MRISEHIKSSLAYPYLLTKLNNFSHTIHDKSF
jgi:hypothetical protein